MEKQWVKIPDVLFFQEGPGVRNTQYTTEGVKLLNVANLVDGRIDLSTSDRYISEEEAYGKYKHFLCDAGDFIIASSGIKVEYIDKKMGFVDETMLPLCMNTSTIRFKVLNEDTLRIRYFMYYAKTRQFKEQLEKQITGSAQLNYGPSHLKKMTLPLVDIDAQDEVIERLDKVHSIIEARQKELNTLDDLIKARFVEMFGNPFDERNEVKWSIKPISELAESISDGSNVDKALYKTSGDVLFLRIQNVWCNDFRLEDSVYISDVENKEYKETSLKHGDLLITKIGRYYTSDSSLGRVSVYLGEDDKANYSNNIMRVRFRDGINSEFVNVLMNLEDYNKFIRRTSVGGTDKRALSKGLIASYPIIVPPIEIQNEFVEFIHQVVKSKAVVQNTLDEAQLLFDSLMQKYFG